MMRRIAYWVLVAYELVGLVCYTDWEMPARVMPPQSWLTVGFGWFALGCWLLALPYCIVYGDAAPAPVAKPDDAPVDQNWEVWATHKHSGRRKRLDRWDQPAVTSSGKVDLLDADLGYGQDEIPAP